MNQEKTKTKEIVKCSVEKETIPRNQVDLKLLRSNFERSTSTASRSDQRRGHSSFCETSPGQNPDGEDVVDQSQPSMAEVLVKFRRLERSRRPGLDTGQRVRSSSADGYERKGSTVERQESGLNRRSLEFEDSEEQDTTPQISNLVALFSKLEGRKSSRSSWNKGGKEQQRLSVTSKGITLQKDREPGQKGQGIEGDGEVELPEEGTVQALLLQWKAMEKPLKKRKSWMETQLSRQAEQRKSQSGWTPSQKTPVSGQKSPGVSQKTPVNFQTTVITTKKSTVSSPNTAWGSQNTKVTPQKAGVTSQMTQAAHQKTQAAPQKTQTAQQKTQTAQQKTQAAPQKTQAAPQKTQVTPQKTQVESHKPFSGVDKIRSTSFNESLIQNGSQKHYREQGRTSECHDGTGKEKEGQEDDDDQVTFDGIAKSMTEKFRELERKNASGDEFDGSLKRKQYRWEVKSLATLGRPQGHTSGTGPIVVTYDTATVTPPSSPEPGHTSDLRQPDVVEHSFGWKSELEEFPLPSQTTKTLREKFEAMPVHVHD